MKVQGDGRTGGVFWSSRRLQVGRVGLRRHNRRSGVLRKVGVGRRSDTCGLVSTLGRGVKRDESGKV